MRLKLAASGSKSAGRPDLFHGGQAFLDVDEIVRTGSQYGVDFVVVEATDLAEVVTDAIEEEFFERGVACPADGRIGQAQFAFDNNLDDALRGPAQRERIFRAGRNQANC